MGLRESLEAKARKWALDKANELLGDKSRPTVDAVPAPPEERADVGEQVVRRLVPGLGDWADQQQARANHQQAADAARRRASIATLPKADVKIQLSGAVDAHWWGRLPVRVEIREPPAEPEVWQAGDPFVTRRSLVVTLTPYDDQQPQLGPKPLTQWQVTVPGYHGDGVYDLVALVRERAATGFEAPYDETWIDLGDDDGTDYECYFYADAGPSTVTVADAARTVTASVSMAGAVGTVVGTLEVRLA